MQPSFEPQREPEKFASSPGKLDLKTAANPNRMEVEQAVREALIGKYAEIAEASMQTPQFREVIISFFREFTSGLIKGTEEGLRKFEGQFAGEQPNNEFALMSGEDIDALELSFQRVETEILASTSDPIKRKLMARQSAEQEVNLLQIIDKQLDDMAEAFERDFAALPADDFQALKHKILSQDILQKKQALIDSIVATALKDGIERATSESAILHAIRSIYPTSEEFTAAQLEARKAGSAALKELFSFIKSYLSAEDAQIFGLVESTATGGVNAFIKAYEKIIDASQQALVGKLYCNN